MRKRIPFSLLSKTVTDPILSYFIVPTLSTLYNYSERVQDSQQFLSQSLGQGIFRWQLACCYYICLSVCNRYPLELIQLVAETIVVKGDETSLCRLIDIPCNYLPPLLLKYLNASIDIVAGGHGSDGFYNHVDIWAEITDHLILDDNQWHIHCGRQSMLLHQG